MDQEPQGGEVGERLALEDAAQIRLDEGRPRQAGIVAHEAKLDAVAAQSPERAVARVEPILYGQDGRAPATLAWKMCARCVEIVGWGDYDDRYAPAARFQCDD